MEIVEERFRPILVTKGRKTGKAHSVWLRAIKYNGKIYFSRHRPDGDWFQNAMVNSEVKIQYNNTEFTGKASLVTDEKLNQKISQLKYPGEKRADEKRVAYKHICVNLTNRGKIILIKKYLRKQLFGSLIVYQELVNISLYNN